MGWRTLFNYLTAPTSIPQWDSQGAPIPSLQPLLHLRQLAIQLLDASNEIENHGRAREVDAQVSPQPLHATKLNHHTPRHQRFISRARNRFDQAAFGESHHERRPCATRLSHYLERQWFIKIRIPHLFNPYFA
jgi:hypothetical protein